MNPEPPVSQTVPQSEVPVYKITNLINLFGETINVYESHFLLYFTVCVVPPIITYVLNAVFNVDMFSSMFGGSTATISYILIHVTEYILIIGAFFISIISMFYCLSDEAITRPMMAWKNGLIGVRVFIIKIASTNTLLLLTYLASRIWAVVTLIFGGLLIVSVVGGLGVGFLNHIIRLTLKSEIISATTSIAMDTIMLGIISTYTYVSFSYVLNGVFFGNFFRNLQNRKKLPILS